MKICDRTPSLPPHLSRHSLARASSVGPGTPCCEDIAPPDNPPIDEIDLHPLAPLGVVVAGGRQFQGRAPIIPVLVMVGASIGVIRLPPEETERVCTHPWSGPTGQDRLAIQRLERLEALCQPDLGEVRRAL